MKVCACLYRYYDARTHAGMCMYVNRQVGMYMRMYVCMYVWYATVCYAMVSYDIVLVWHGVEAADQTQQLYLIVSTEMEAGVLLEAWLPRPASCWVSDPQLNLSGGFDCRSAVRAWYVQITISKFLSACVYTYMSICKCISIYLPIYRSIYSSIHLSAPQACTALRA